MFLSYIKNLKPWHLSHKNPEVFVISQWCKPKSIFFLLYRYLLAITFIGILTYSITNSIIVNHDFGFWFIYLTNNGLLICTLTTTYAATLTTFYQFDWIRLETESKSYKIYWLLSNVSIVLAFVISIVYWSVLFKWDIYFKGE